MASKTGVKYAVSIQMKHGEILHIEGIDREERDKYFELARRKEASLVVESKNNIRNIMSTDIASISSKSYDAVYEKTVFRLEKMLFSESSIGSSMFYTIIKLFVLVGILSIVAKIALTFIQGDTASVLVDSNRLGDVFKDGLALVKQIFDYTLIVMLVLSVIDILLGLGAHYYINRDGLEPVNHRRMNGLIITVIFAVVMFIIFRLI